MTLEHLVRPLATGAGGPAALWIAFLAGVLASAVCPCTLPVGLGLASVAGASEAGSRRAGLQVAGSFFTGIVLSLAALGSAVGHLGALATEAFGRSWALLMAVVSLAAALLAFWWPRLRTRALTAWRRPGLLGAFAYGVVFSVGTSVAPLLLLLTVAAAEGRAGRGIVLALAFGLGRGLPFLAAGAAGSAVTRLARLGVWGRALQLLSGAALLLVSAYYARVYADLL